MNSAPSAAMNIWQPRIREKNTELPQDFVPTPYTVHIGRGKMCSDATGNRRLKVIVDSFLGEYKKASNKMEKSSGLLITKVAISSVGSSSSIIIIIMISGGIKTSSMI